jgi:hypothetical protein
MFPPSFDLCNWETVMYAFGILEVLYIFLPSSFWCNVMVPDEVKKFKIHKVLIENVSHFIWLVAEF